MNRYKSNYWLIDALQERAVNAKYIRALWPLCSEQQNPKFDLKKKNQRNSCSFKESYRTMLFVKWLETLWYFFGLSPYGHVRSVALGELREVLLLEQGKILFVQKLRPDNNTVMLHTKTFQSHVPLCGDVFYCYFTGCVCIKNKIFLKKKALV